jgi:hypothetical protein
VLLNCRLNLKRSSSAPMINQLGIGPTKEVPGTQDVSTSVVPHTSGLASSSGHSSGGGHSSKESSIDIDASSLANSFLSSLGGPRPRRFSASFSPVCFFCN